MSEINTPRTDAMMTSGHAHYMSLNLARQLERELIQAQQTIAQKAEQIRQLHWFIEDTERRAKTFMLNGSFTMFKNEHEQLKAKALSTPAPVAVVPWEVYRDAVSALHYIEHSHGRLYGVGWDRVYEAEKNYAPKGNQ